MKWLLFKIQIILWLTGCLCMLSCMGNSSPKLNSVLSLDEVREDFSQLTEKIEKEVPNAFYYYEKSDYELVKQSVYDQLKEGMTTEELFKVFYPLVQCLNDAHFAIHLPEEMMNNSEISYFPIKVIIHNDRLYALEDLSAEPQIKKGEEILFINRISSKEILKKLKGTTYQNQRDQLFFEYRNEAVFHRRLYALFGFTGNFEVKTIDHSYSLKGVDAEQLKISQKEDYEFKMLNTEIG